MIRFQIEPATMAVATRVVEASIEVLPEGAELSRLTVDDTDQIEAVIYGPDDVTDAGARLLAHALGLTKTRDHAYNLACVFRYRKGVVDDVAVTVTVLLEPEYVDGERASAVPA